MASNGVTEFRQKVLTLNYPADKAYTCQFCQLCRSDQGGLRWRCIVTGEILYDTKDIGYLCPLEDKEEEENND